MLFRRIIFLLLAVLVLSDVEGCAKKKMRPLASVGGKVTYRGQPLHFGCVTFRPASGQSAMGLIQPDGSFQLETTGEGVGAVVGPNRVSVTCYEGQSPTARRAGKGESPLGKPLIPIKYAAFETSGLEFTVRPADNPPFLIDLKD